MRALVIGIGVVLIAAVIVTWWSGGARSDSEAAVQAPRFEGEVLPERVELEPFVAMTPEPAASAPEESLRRSVERAIVASSKPVKFWLRAVDVRGNALAFAVVEVVEMLDEDLAMPVRIVADRHGRFEWSSSAAEVALAVSTSRIGVRLSGEVRCEVARARTTPCDVVLEPLPLLISGRVVDARGLPIEGARMEATLLTKWPEVVHPSTEVEDGLLDDLSAVVHVESRRSDGLPDPRPERVRLPLDAAAKLSRANTDSRGGFQFQGDTEGDWVSVDVRAGGFQPVERLSWLRGTSNVTIVLDAVATVKGRLLLHPSVNALGLAVVAKSTLDTSAGGRGVVLHDGRFVLTQLPSGTHALYLSSNNKFYAPSLELPFVLASNVALVAGEVLDIGVIDLSERLLETHLDLDEEMLLSTDEDGIQARYPLIIGYGGPPQSPTILHGPGEWIVPLHAQGYRSTHVQLTGGRVRVEFEPE